MQIDNLQLSRLGEAADKLRATFAVYDKSFRLIFANRTAREAIPALFDALDTGATLYEATVAEIRRQSPDWPDDKIHELAKVFETNQLSGTSYELYATGNRVFQAHHDWITDDYFVGIGTETTEIKKNEQRLKELAAENHKLANIDPLTNLPNRRSFMTKVENLIERHKNQGTSFIVAMLDLDEFKRVNDIFGHQVGDLLLQKASARIQAIVGKYGFVARLGGDEFAIVTEKSFTDAEFVRTGNTCCKALSAPFKLDEHVANVAASVGMARFPDAGDTATRLLDRADYALYHAKENGKGQTAIFSEEHEIAIRRQSTLEQQLRRDDLESEIYLEYQPIIDSSKRRINGYEALARWQNRDLGKVPPTEFIPAAERTRQSQKLTAIIVKKALADAESWPEHLKLSINLSASDLQNPSCPEMLLEIISNSTIEANRIVFEVTESTLINDPKRAIEAINILRSSGAKIAIDDFGTGYSSLAYLSQMPVDIVKIDRAFMKDLQKEENAAIVQTMAYLCRRLNLECVVEGIETPTQLHLLRATNISLMQGYLFSHPLPAKLVKSTLKLLDKRFTPAPEGQDPKSIAS